MRRLSRKQVLKLHDALLDYDSCDVKFSGNQWSRTELCTGRTDRCCPAGDKWKYQCSGTVGMDIRASGIIK